LQCGQTFEAENCLLFRGVIMIQMYED
jgi:hypothetical protein